MYVNFVPVETAVAVVNDGEVSEWSKEHAWKVCIPKGIEGSNPSLTAIKACLIVSVLNIPPLELLLTVVTLS